VGHIGLMGGLSLVRKESPAQTANQNKKAEKGYTRYLSERGRKERTPLGCKILNPFEEQKRQTASDLRFFSSASQAEKEKGQLVSALRGMEKKKEPRVTGVSELLDYSIARWSQRGGLFN